MIVSNVHSARRDVHAIWNGSCIRQRISFCYANKLYNNIYINFTYAQSIGIQFIFDRVERKIEIKFASRTAYV